MRIGSMSIRDAQKLKGCVFCCILPAVAKEFYKRDNDDSIVCKDCFDKSAGFDIGGYGKSISKWKLYRIDLLGGVLKLARG